MRQRAAASDVVIVNHHLLCADACGPPERVRRGDSRVQPRGDRRSAPARGRRDAVLRLQRQQLPGRGAGARRRAARAARAPSIRRSPAARSPARSRASATTRARSSASSRSRTGRATRRAARSGSGRRRRRSGTRARRRSICSARIDALDVRAAAPGGVGRRRRPTRARRPRRRSPRSCAARGRTARRPALPAARLRARVRLLRRVPRAGHLPAGVADRRLDDRPRAAARPHADDRADVGDADGGRRRSSTSGRGWASRAPTSCACASEFDFARQAILYLPPRMPDPRSPDFAAGRGARGRGDSPAHARPRLRAVHELRVAARGAGHRRDGARLPDSRAGHGAAHRSS